MELSSIHKIRNQAHIRRKEFFFQKKSVERILYLSLFISRKLITYNLLKYEPYNYLRRFFEGKHFI